MSYPRKLPPVARPPRRGNQDIINSLVQKTYRIELKINFAEDENHNVMLTIAKQYARDLLGSAMLLQDKTKPGVVLFAEDSFFNMDEIDLLDESNNIHTP